MQPSVAVNNLYRILPMYFDIVRLAILAISHDIGQNRLQLTVDMGLRRMILMRQNPHSFLLCGRAWKRPRRFPRKAGFCSVKNAKKNRPPSAGEGLPFRTPILCGSFMGPLKPMFL